MSNIPKLRFKEFKEPWKENKLQNIGSISMCKRVLKKDTNEIGDIPFYKIGTFGKKADAYISNDYFKTLKEKYKYPKKGDILLSAAGTIGRTVEFDGLEAYFQDSNIVWLNNNEKIIQNKFLHLLYNNLNWVSQDTTIKRLVNSTINSTVINYPKDIKEQEKIATFINSVDTYINQLDEKENLMEEYIKGVNQQIFSQKIRFKKDDGSDYEDWIEIRLGDFSELKNGFAFKSTNYVENGKYIVMTIKNVQQGELSFKNISTIDNLPNNIKKHQILKKGDILISMTGDCGRVGRVEQDNLLLNQRVGLIEIKREINDLFLFYSLNTSNFHNAMISSGQGNAHDNLSKGSIENYKFNIPKNKEEQEKIANFLQSLNQELLNIREEKELTKEFKKGLLQQMFV